MVLANPVHPVAAPFHEFSLYSIQCKQHGATNCLVMLPWLLAVLKSIVDPLVWVRMCIAQEWQGISSLKPESLEPKTTPRRFMSRLFPASQWQGAAET